MRPQLNPSDAGRTCPRRVVLSVSHALFTRMPAAIGPCKLSSSMILSPVVPFPRYCQLSTKERSPIHGMYRIHGTHRNSRNLRNSRHRIHGIHRFTDDSGFMLTVDVTSCLNTWCFLRKCAFLDSVLCSFPFSEILKMFNVRKKTKKI